MARAALAYDKYYWIVRQDVKAILTKQPADLPLRLPFRHAVNFRDLGGYRTADGRVVRFGRVYRSDSLCSLDSDDLALLQSLGLRTLCDFRVGGERRLRPDRLPAGHGITVHDLGLLPRGSKEMWQGLNAGTLTAADMLEEVRNHYRLFVLEHSDRFRQMFDLLLGDHSLPMLVHCASGKDRTGFAVSLLLTALGVEWPAIVSDYVLSDHYRRDLAQVGGDAMQSEAVGVLLRAHPDYLDAAYSTIAERWGSVDAYLAEEIGLTPERRLELEDRLLEPRA